MIEFSALSSLPTIDRWCQINEIVMGTFKDYDEWETGGYKGLTKLVKEYFGITMYRGKDSYIVYQFPSEEEYMMFLLKYS